jgi:cellobiose transport system permease protein
MTTSTFVVRVLTRRRFILRENLGRLDLAFSPYLFVSPFFLLFGLVGLFPLVYTGWVSIHHWDLLGGALGWAGLDNFAFVLQQRQFWVALRNTVSIFLISAVPQLIVATAIAAALDTHLRNKTFWRMGVLLPFVVMPVAVTLIFGSMFGERYGLVNRTLADVGLAIATMVNFRWTGYNALILLAGMQAIPRDLYEAATIDGATWLKRFFLITIPQLRPTIVFVIITATIGGLQIFDEPRLYDQNGLGGEDQQWMTMTIYLYKLGWTQLNFGRAAAVAWLLFVVIVAVGLINLFLTRRIATSGERGR